MTDQNYPSTASNEFCDVTLLFAVITRVCCAFELYVFKARVGHLNNF